MKLIVVIYLLSISFKLAAQPDSKYFIQSKFYDLTVKIKEDSNNDSLIWERIKLSGFNTLKAEIPLDDYYDVFYKSIRLFPYKDPNQLFDDLNKVISNDIVFEDHNIAYFKMLRGKLYFHSDEKNKAIKDYLSALNYSDSINTAEYIKRELYISIAAYYYNLDNSIKEKNARQVLKFIQMVCPEIDLYLSDDCFERDKKELLKLLNEIQLLTNYYRELILAEYNDFRQKTTFGYGQNLHSHEHYYRTLMRIYELVEFYKKNGNYQKSRSLKKRLIKFLPTDNNGKSYKKFPKNSFYVWMHEYKSNTPFDDWNNKNKTKVNKYYQDLPEFIRSITL